MKISNITKYLPIGSYLHFSKERESLPSMLNREYMRKFNLKELGHYTYALIGLALLANYVIFPLVSKGIDKIAHSFNASPVQHNYEVIRKYTDTNKNGLYDTVETHISVDWKCISAKTMAMGKECTREEVEKITANRTPYETIKLEEIDYEPKTRRMPKPVKIDDEAVEGLKKAYKSIEWQKEERGIK
jgi:hypothetical protein